MLLEKEDNYRNDMITFLWELQENYKYRVKRLWNDYKTSPKEKRVNIIEQLRHEDRQMFEILEQLGLMPSNVDRALAGITYVSFKKEINDDNNESNNDINNQ